MHSIFITKSVATKQCLWQTIFHNWLLYFQSFHTWKIFVNLFFDLDRNKTDSRRFKPNSCIILIGEQPNPLQRLHHKDIIKSTSRWQTKISLWSLNFHYSVIPMVPFICWSNKFSFIIFGSLKPTFVTVQSINFYSIANI